TSSSRCPRRQRTSRARRSTDCEGASAWLSPPAIGSDRRLLRSGSRARRERRRRRCNRSVLRQPGQIRLFLARQLSGDANRTGAQNLRRDHHDQLGTAFLRSLAAEQKSENRDIADAGDLLHRRRHAVVQQSGDRERLPIAKLDFRLRAAGGERRNAEAAKLHGIGEVERADLRPYLQVNAIAVDDRRERKANAVLLEHDGDADVGARPLRDRNRELAAGEEGRFLPAFRDEIWLGKALEQAA